jgi:hypothetical protein
MEMRPAVEAKKAEQAEPSLRLIQISQKSPRQATIQWAYFQGWNTSNVLSFKLLQLWAQITG